jgi:hypothetical protein
MRYVDYVYQIVKKDAGDLDAIYEDYICHIVGVSGLFALKEEGLLEGCGIVNSRRLYALVNRES